MNARDEIVLICRMAGMSEEEAETTAGKITDAHRREVLGKAAGKLWSRTLLADDCRCISLLLDMADLLCDCGHRKESHQGSGDVGGPQCLSCPPGVHHFKRRTGAWESSKGKE